MEVSSHALALHRVRKFVGYYTKGLSGDLSALPPAKK